MLVMMTSAYMPTEIWIPPSVFLIADNQSIWWCVSLVCLMHSRHRVPSKFSQFDEEKCLSVWSNGPRGNSRYKNSKFMLLPKLTKHFDSCFTRFLTEVIPCMLFCLQWNPFIFASNTTNFIVVWVPWNLFVFLVAPCCSQGATLQVTLWCRLVVCLVVCLWEQPPPQTWFSLQLRQF